MAALGDLWHIKSFFFMCGALDFQILADVVGLCRKPIADLFEHAAVFPADLVGSTVIPADLVGSAVIPADLFRFLVTLPICPVRSKTTI